MSNVVEEPKELDFDDDDQWEDPKKQVEEDAAPMYKRVVSSSPFNIMQVGCVSILQVGLNAGEMVRAESNALVTALPASVKISASTNGGVFQAASRAFAGESFFLQEITAKEDGVMLELAPKSLHGLAEICLKEGISYYIRKDGFFAAQRNIKCAGTIGGAKEFVAQSLALLQVEENGWFVVEAYGGVKQLHIPKGKSAIVDNSHLVAWPTHAKYSVRRASNSIMDSIMSGEYVVLKFKGPCTVYVSYAREETVERRVSGVNTATKSTGYESVASGLGATLGNAISGRIQNGGGLGIEEAIKGIFRGFGMIMLLLFVMFVIVPRLFM